MLYHYREKIICKEKGWNIFHTPQEKCVYVRKLCGQLQFINVKEFEDKNSATIQQIEDANKIYRFPNFPWVIINNHDSDYLKTFNKIYVWSCCTSSNNYTFVTPDFVFDHWRAGGIDNYTNVCQEFAKIGELPPETNLLGWRGANTHKSRAILVSKSDGINIDAHWASNIKKDSNYISLFDQIRKWRFVIDMGGWGWSGRTKIYFFSKRVFFIVDRVHKEYWHPLIKPWVHYVPVKVDMSDLIKNLEIVKSNHNLEKTIIEEAYKFATVKLTREACLLRWKNLFTKMII